MLTGRRVALAALSSVLTRHKAGRSEESYAALFASTLRVVKATRAALKAGALCEYCETDPADGWLRETHVLVCEACYEDHHGGVL